MSGGISGGAYSAIKSSWLDREKEGCFFRKSKAGKNFDEQCGKIKKYF